MNTLTPVLEREEYIEQAYFFRMLRERLAEGRPAQEILAQIDKELLSTTKLVFAVGFMLAELKHSGQLSQAVAKMPHYFTPYQAHVLLRAEQEESRFAFDPALLILEREAQYRAAAPVTAGLFVFQLETISRNRLGYAEGLAALQGDAFYDEHWRRYIAFVWHHLGVYEFADLVYVRSEYCQLQKRQSDPDYQPGQPILFSEKEGRIAAANRGKDPAYLFATLQRQLGYPEVPRPIQSISDKEVIEELQRKVKTLETRLELLEAEMRGQLDITQFYVKKDESKPVAPPRLDWPDDDA